MQKICGTFQILEPADALKVTCNFTESHLQHSDRFYARLSVYTATMMHCFNKSKKCLRILLQFIAVLNLQSFSTLAQQTQAPTSTISPSLSYGPTSYAPTPLPTYDFSVTPSSNSEEEDFYRNLYISVMVVAIIMYLCLSGLQSKYRSMETQRALSTTRQTMSERRRQRLQQAAADAGAGGESSTPPVDPTPRYEVILSKFYFQTVLPDKSNTNSQSLRLVEEETPPPGQGGETTPIAAFAPTSPTKSTMSGSLSDRLASWRKPSSKDGCCICLDGYHAGETICAAVTSECNHVFHQECVVEWLQSNDLCPLCRVDLMKD